MNTSTRYRMVSEGTQGRYRSEAEEYRRRMRGYGNDPDDYRGADPMKREEWDRDGGVEPGRAEPNNYRRFSAEGTGDGTYRMAYESNGTSRRMAGFFKMTRAMEMRCFSPPESLRPRLPTCVS